MQVRLGSGLNKLGLAGSGLEAQPSTSPHVHIASKWASHLKIIFDSHLPNTMDSIKAAYIASAYAAEPHNMLNAEAFIMEQHYHQQLMIPQSLRIHIFKTRRASHERWLVSTASQALSFLELTSLHPILLSLSTKLQHIESNSGKNPMILFSSCQRRSVYSGW